MAKLTQKISPVDLYQGVTDIPGAELLGSVERGLNGKEFMYILAGASNLVLGNLLQSSAIDTQFDDMVVPAAVASTTPSGGAIGVTNGTTVVAVDDYKGGTACDSNGEEYTIIGNNAAANGALLNLFFDRPIRTAWTVSTTVTLRKNPGFKVIQCPTTLTGQVVGAALFAIPATQYGWIQMRGTANVLSDASTGAVGSSLSNSASVAGAVGVAVSGTGRTGVGAAQRALSSAKQIPVWLKL